MRATRIFFALILIVVAVLSATVLRAQTSDRQTPEQGLQGDELIDVLAQQKQSRAQRLQGSWVITVTAVVPPGVPPPPVRTSYASFAGGGVSIHSDRQAPNANPGHGVWEHRGGNHFAFTFITDDFDATGNFLGTVKVRNKIILTGPDEFVGVGNLELSDSAGNVLFSRCATIRGQRIRIEPLAEQCQGITPPR